MNRLTKAARILIGAFLLAAPCAPCAFAADTLGADLPAKLFPMLERYSDAELRLRGLAAVAPGHVLFEEPLPPPAVRRPDPIATETLQDDIRYIRVYSLDVAEEVLEGALQSAPAVILDLRFLSSASSGSRLAALLGGGRSIAPVLVGEAPAEVREELETLRRAGDERDYPAVVLVNRATAGPFEATLHDLQASGAIIAIGQTTAGRTGFYRRGPFESWLLEGELSPADGRSLVGLGFEPRIRQDLTPEASYLAYHLYEAGSPIAHTLMKNPAAEPEQDPEPAVLGATDDTDPDAPEAPEASAHRTGSDPALIRAVEVIKALRILEYLPENP